MSAADPDNPFLATLSGHVRARPPIWLMRQAGRYLPEYRELRATAPSFLEFCYTPRLATEVTLQPIRRFGFDAAILFSDILVVPDALGQKVSFETGEGPRLDPFDDAVGFARLRETLDMGRLAPMLETVERTRAALGSETALIGFCGAPFTLATYMIAGRGTPDQGPARLLAYRDPELFAHILSRLVDSCAQLLVAQLKAGADAVQIFDSWAGALPANEFRRWCVGPLAAIVAKTRAAVPGARIIAFPRAAGAHLAEISELDDIAAVGLDTCVDPAWAAEEFPRRLATQGNLDPLALLTGGAALDAAVDRILAAFEGRPHIFNLGHGVLPPTPTEHVARLVARVRGAA